jgi:hypothetical protein
MRFATFLCNCGENEMAKLNYKRYDHMAMKFMEASSEIHIDMKILLMIAAMRPARGRFSVLNIDPEFLDAAIDLITDEFGGSPQDMRVYWQDYVEHVRLENSKD